MANKYLVICIDNTEAEELTVGQVYEVYDSVELTEFYILNNQPYLKTRFTPYENTTTTN